MNGCSTDINISSRMLCKNVSFDLGRAVWIWSDLWTVGIFKGFDII